MVGVILLVMKLYMDGLDVPHGLVTWLARFLPSFSMGYGICCLALDDLITIQEEIDGTLEPLDHRVAGYDFYGLWVQFVIYFSLTILLEHLAKIRSCTEAFAPTQVLEEDPNEDDDVTKEKQSCEKVNPQDVAVKVEAVGQIYGNKCKPKEQKVAIKGISFSVEKGQIFALLGINGAGKSSTFKILTGECTASTGSAWIAGYKTDTQFDQIYKIIGYCPQYNILTDQLTVQENLDLFAEIKGINVDYKEKEIKYLKELLEIKKYSNKQAKILSGGNKRKLCMALTLQGMPQILFLDEPTAGMDPQARHHLFRVVNKYCLIKKCSVVITTHSMEEAELIADKIVIMVNGRFKCIGAAQHLKNKFGYGYEIDINVVHPEQYQIDQEIQSICQILNIQQFENLQVSMDQIKVVLESKHLVNQLFGEISYSGTGSAIFQSIKDNKQVEANLFIEWLLVELSGMRIQEWLKQIFQTVKLIEHYQFYYKFSVDNQGITNGFIFGTLEENKLRMGIQEYSIAQTTLEQIFNKFAKESEGDRSADGQPIVTSQQT